MKLVITENITLDGVIDATGDWFSAADEDRSDTSDLEESLREQMHRQSGLLLGRLTFESFRGYWPRQTDDTTGVTAHLNSIHKYVITSTLEDPGWENTTVLRGDLLDEVRALKAQPGGDLGVTGSISVVHQLIAAGLVDEYRLFLYPVVLGRGERLFTGGAERMNMELVGATAFRSGIVLLTYSVGQTSSG